MTNHHVGADCLQKISTKEKDYLATGFEARSYAQEPKCADLELNVLMSIEDVTARVNGAVKPGMDPAAAEMARRAEINDIEKESLDKTGLRSDVVTLYNGGQYQLYRYKRYTDVRLVFAPQKAIAFFGGDPDNFEYPRYDLDICFFRVYENDKPVHVDNYLKWSEAGAAEGELVFVSGNPGRTERVDTVAHLEYQRDYAMPGALNLLRRREVLLENYSERSKENARRAEDELFGIKNSRKAFLGMLAGLQDPAIIAKKRSRKGIAGSSLEGPEIEQAYGDGWDQVAATLKTLIKIRDEYNLFAIGPQRGAQSFNSELFDDRHQAGATGGGNAQAKRRAPARIFRCRSRFPETAAIFRRADLRRPGNREARRLAGNDGGDHGRGKRNGPNRAGRQIAPRTRRGTGSWHGAQGCCRPQTPRRRRTEGDR